eukprot:tig00021438_g21454.t1
MASGDVDWSPDCPLCEELLRQPVVLPCGCCFCLQCIKKLKSRVCPRCGPPNGVPQTLKVCGVLAGALKRIQLQDKVGGSFTHVDLGELELAELLGEGSFGKVFLARWNGMSVACKFLQEAGTDELQAFEKELAVLSRLRHPNVVLLLGASLDPPMLVTEFCAGGTIEGLIAAAGPRGLERDLAYAVALDVARGMQYLHSQAILHRDLKTANVLVDKSGRAKICDFGMSRIKQMKTMRARRSSGNLRGGGGPVSLVTQAFGTPQYIAPEIWRGGEFGPKTDVFAYAIVLWEIQFGHEGEPYPECHDIPSLSAYVKRGLRPAVPPKLRRDPLVQPSSVAPARPIAIAPATPRLASPNPT